MANQPALQTGIVQIGNKEYKTVALRITEFREAEEFKGYACITEIIALNESTAVMKCCIYNADKVLVATGHSEEYRNKGSINRTSALENAETSAIGRALANLGFGGTEFASANEVQAAIQQQKTPASPEQKGQIVALLEEGHIQPAHLAQAFGHSDVNKLLEVEAARILQAFANQQRATMAEKMKAQATQHGGQTNG